MYGALWFCGVWHRFWVVSGFRSCGDGCGLVALRFVWFGVFRLSCAVL